MMHDHFLWLAALAAVLAILIVLAYLSRARGRMLRLRIEMDKTWAAVDALLKQRHDELPKLLGTCRGYMPHDHPAFEPVSRARADYLKARTAVEKALANIAMADAIESLFKVASEDPGLKTNANFIKLRKQNAELERNIEEQQKLFNELAQVYNKRIRRFPDSLAARRARLKPRETIPIE